MLTPLLGPRPGNPKVFAIAQGALSVSTDDLIAFTKTLKKKGDLYDEVLFE